MFKKEIEDKLRKLGKHKSLSEMPGFPFDSFQKLKEEIQKNKYTIGVDYSAATESALLVNDNLGKLTIILLSIIPWVTLVVAILFAVLLKSYYLFFAIPVIGLTFVFSNPLCPFRNFISFIGYVGTISLLFVIFTGSQTLFWLLSCFVITFWSVRWLYMRTTTALRQALMNSESFFIYSYEKKACNIKNNQSGKVYSFGR